MKEAMMGGNPRLDRSLLASPARTFLTLVAVCLFVPAGCERRDPDAVRGGEGALFLYRRGAEKHREGDFEAAVAFYEKALSVEPELAEAHLDIGIICDDYLLDKESAVVHYEEYLKLQPRSEKADMVARWIRKTREEKVEGVASRKAGALSAGASESAGARGELARVKDDLVKLKAENVSYLRTVNVLRDELEQSREEIKRVLSGAGESVAARGAGSVDEEKLRSLARSLQSEKSELREKYRSEKDRLEGMVGRLKKNYDDLKSKKDASEKALLRTRAELRGTREKRGTKTDTSLLNALAGAREKTAILERKNRLYIKDNKALKVSLKKAEKSRGEYRTRALSLESKYKAVELLAKEAKAQAQAAKAQAQAAKTQAQAKANAPASPHVMAKARADAERVKQELAQSYEKKILDLKTTRDRQAGAGEKQLTDARRETARLREQMEKQRETHARTEQALNRTIAGLREQYHKETGEMKQRFRREKEILMSKLSEAQRIALPRNSPAPRKKPAVSGAPPSAATSPRRRARRAVPTPVSARRYRVGKGDTLSSIATRYYGNRLLWKKIYDANRSILPSPNSLTKGQILVIP